jgi:hypothetical protein
MGYTDLPYYPGFELAEWCPEEGKEIITTS